MQVKDVMHDNLAKLFQRGEQLESLQQKTDEIRTISGSIHKKAKKQNSWWATWGCAGPGGLCGTPAEASRGLQMANSYAPKLN
jgi:hypothetical protein